MFTASIVLCSRSIVAKTQRERAKEGGEDRQPTLMGQKATKSVTVGCHKILNFCISRGHVEVGAYLNAPFALPPNPLGCRLSWFQNQLGSCTLTGSVTLFLVMQLERGDRATA